MLKRPHYERRHCIRLELTSPCFPRYGVNPNTGEALGLHTHTRVAQQTVFHGAAHPSRLVLQLQG